MKHSDEYWMQQCLELAKRGAGSVSPNPLVGCVIVQNGKKIAEGYHKQFGGPHAEVNAINAALSKNKKLTGATLYVNLEPCSHHGKTPPCADAILRHGFARVVIGMKDPNPRVSGNGIRKLRGKGVKCTVGVLKKEAGCLNEHFFKFITTGIPFVALKAAQTSDGFIAKEDGSSRWITNNRSRTYVHRLRAMHDAVLVGATTVMQDDPLLTVRHVDGTDPVRVIIDGRFTVTADKKIFSSSPKTIVYVAKGEALRKKEKLVQLQKKGVEIIRLNGKNGHLRIKDIVNDLGRRNIASILVEGGQTTFASFLSEKVADKMFLFTSRKKFGQGIKTFPEKSVSYKKRLHSVKQFGTDILQEFEIIFP